MSAQAPVVAAVTTDIDEGQGAAARNLLERFPGSELAVAKLRERIEAATGLSATGDLAPLLGNDVVLAGPLAAWVVKDEAKLGALLAGLKQEPPSLGYELHSRSGVLIATKGPVLVAGEPAAVRDALTRRARTAGMTPALFAERMRGLPAGALVRAQGDLRAAGISLPYADSLGRFALTVRSDATGLHARLRAAATGDPPIAIGAQAPTPLLRSNGATVGIRDLRPVIRFALARLQQTNPGAYRKYELARKGLKLLRRADVDRDIIGQLGGTATLWTPDLATFTLSAPVADPGRMANALKNVRPLLERALGDRVRGLRYGVTSDSLVVTTDRTTPLATLSAGRPGRLTAQPGAVAGVVRAQLLRDALIRRLRLPSLASLALGALGDATFALHAEPAGLEAAADLQIR